jgi:hypothetical protein
MLDLRCPTWFARSRNRACMSPCRSDYIFIRLRGVWRVVSEGSRALRWRGQEIWPPRKIFRCLSRKELKGEIVAHTLGAGRSSIPIPRRPSVANAFTVNHHLSNEAHESSLLIVRTKRFLLLQVRLDTRMFQHLARLLTQITLGSPPYLYFPVFRIFGRMGASVEDSAPPKLPATHGPRLDPNRVRHCKIQEWYFTDESRLAETTLSTSPTYATHEFHRANTKL